METFILLLPSLHWPSWMRNSSTGVCRYLWEKVKNLLHSEVNVTCTWTKWISFVFDQIITINKSKGINAPASYPMSSKRIWTFAIHGSSDSFLLWASIEMIALLRLLPNWLLSRNRPTKRVKFKIKQVQKTKCRSSVGFCSHMVGVSPTKSTDPFWFRTWDIQITNHHAVTLSTTSSKLVIFTEWSLHIWQGRILHVLRNNIGYVVD